MARKLARTVTVGGTTYLAGTTPPDEVAAKITVDAAWEPADAGDDQAETGDDAEQQRGDGDQNDDAGDGSDEAGSTDPLQEPPRTGRGSTEEAWRGYAQALGVTDVPEDAGRDDVIALLAERGFIDA